MNKDRYCKLWLSLAGFLVAAGMSVGITQSALAQIIEDNTLDNDRVDLNASGAVSGMISLPDVTFIENDLVELPELPVNPDVLAASSCVVRRQTQIGRFIITGSGSLPERPREAAILPYSNGMFRPLPSEPSSDAGESLPWRQGEPIVESQGSIRSPMAGWS